MKKLCIVLDGLHALRGGGQTYLRNLFKHYEPNGDEKVVAILPCKFKDFFAVNPAIKILSPKFPCSGVLQRVLWSRFGLPRLLSELKADVLYCPAGYLYAQLGQKCSTAVAFRNMLPFSSKERSRFPLGYMRARLWLLKHVQKASFRNANLIIFISRYAKSVIDRTVDIKADTTIIHHGLDDHFRTPQPRPLNPRLPDAYVLYVSILNVYKAQIELINSWHILRNYRPIREKLVLVGPEFAPYGKRVRAEIARLGLKDEVIILGSVPYVKLPAYYQHATVNVFASSCENCPNILLEALAGSRPVLCSDFQPMPEFGADAVQYFDPYKPEQLAEKLSVLLNDKVAQQEWGKRAARRAVDFQWSVAARQTWSALRHLAEEVGYPK